MDFKLRLMLFFALFGLAQLSFASGVVSLGSGGTLPTAPVVSLNSTHYPSLSQAIITGGVQYNITPVAVPFGSVAGLAAGKSVYYSNPINGTNYITNVTVQPVQPSLTEVINGQPYAVTNQTQVIQVADFNGHAGVTSNPYLPISLQLQGSLLNPLGITYTVRNDKNNHVIQTQTLTTSNLNQNLNFNMPLNSTYSIDVNVTPNNNYTAITSDPVIIPNNVIAVLPVNVFNQQAQGYLANGVLLLGTSAANVVIGFPANSYQLYETCNLNNVGFTNAAGVYYSSYMVGNIANVIQTSNSCANNYAWPALASSANVVFDIKIPTAQTLFPATSANNIYMVFSGNYISGGINTIMTGVSSGEAGYLDACANDNGANVFVAYNSFCGVTSLPSVGYSNSIGTSIGGLSSVSSNVFVTGSGSTGNVIFQQTGFSKTTNTIGNTVDIAAIAQFAVSGLTNFLGVMAANSLGGTFTIASCQFCIQFGSGGVMKMNVQGTASASSLSIGTTAAIYSFMINNAVSANAMISYNQPASIQEVKTTGTVAGNALILTNSNTNPFSLFVFDTRPTPPANISATTTYGTIDTVPSLSISAPSNAIVDVGQWESFTATATGGVQAFVFAFNSVNSVTTSTVTNTMVFSSVSSQTQLWTFYIGSLDTSNSPEEANTFMIDSQSLQSNSVFSSTYTIATALNNAPTLAITNTMIDQGQYSKFTPTVSAGGATPYVVNIIISNSITKAPLNSIVQTSSSPVAKLMYFPAILGSNSLQVNVVVYDSATTNEIANSIYYALGFNAIPSALPITPTSPSIDLGMPITLTSSTSSGTGPLTINWFTGATCNTFTGSTGTTYTPFPVTSTTYTYNVVDSATYQYSVCSASDTVTVNPAQIANVLTETNTVIDSGMYSRLAGGPQAGTGTPGYTVNWFTGSACNTAFGAPGANILVNPISTTTYSYNVVDSATPANSICTQSNTVTVNADPTITLSPSSATILVGGTVIYTNVVTGGTAPFTYSFTVNNLGGVTIGSNQITFANAGTYNVFERVTDTFSYTSISNPNAIVTTGSEQPPAVTGFPSNGIVYNSLTTLTVTSTPSGDTVKLFMTLQGQAQGSALATGVSPLTYTFCSGANFCPPIGYYTINAFDTDPSSNVLNTIVYVPVNMLNTTALTSFAATPTRYVPAVNNPTGGNYIGNVVYTSSVALTNNLFVLGGLTINSGQTLTTNGFSLIMSGNFINNGKLNPSNAMNGGAGGTGGTVGGNGGGGSFGLYLQAANIIAGVITDNGVAGFTGGGGGGGGGAGTIIFAYADAFPSNTNVFVNGGAQGSTSGGSNTGAGGYGGNTLANGGTRGGSVGSAGGVGTNAIYPTLTNAQIYIMYSNSISQYLAGGGGGGGSSSVPNQGAGGGNYLLSYGGSGGGGGINNFQGGAGGSGLIINYHYTEPPILLGQFSTYYPYVFNTISPNSLITYTANYMVNGGSQVNAQQSATNIAFEPSPSAASGQYEYNFTECGTNCVNIYANLSVNMSDIKSAFTFNNPIIQYFPNLAYNGLWTTAPTSWYIQSDVSADQHSNTIVGDQWSNANQVFIPSIVLSYPGFAAFTVNLLNNPQATQSISQSQFTFFTQNTIPSNIYSREVFNSVAYDMQFFFNYGALKADSEQMLFNNYTLLPSNTYSTIVYPGNNVQTYMAAGNYQNPNVIVQNYTTVVTAVGYSGQTINNYCPFTLTASQWANAYSYLPNVNASAYALSVYQASGNPANNYTLLVQSFSPAVTVLSLKLINAANMQIYLEPNTNYRFLIYNKLCQLVYTSAYQKWTSPITITLSASASLPPPYLPQNLSTVNAFCINTPNTPSANTMQTQCTFSNLANTNNALDMQLLVQSSPYTQTTCANQIVANNGVLTCWSPGTNGIIYSYSLQVQFNNGSGWLDRWTGIFGSQFGGFGLDAALLAMVTCIILAFLFVRYNIAISIILVGIAVEAYGLIEVINLPVLAGGGFVIFTGVGLAILMRNQ